MEKTIYVKEEDLPLFEEAEKILGEESLSAAIAESLRKAIEREKISQEGWEEVELREYRDPGVQLADTEYGRKIRFFGRLLAHHRFLNGETGSQDDRGVTWKVWETRGNKIVAWVDDWSRWRGEPSTGWVKIWDSLEEAREELPEAVLIEARENLGQDVTVYIE